MKLTPNAPLAAAPCVLVAPTAALLGGTAVPAAARVRTDVDAFGAGDVDAPPPRGAPV